MLISAPTELLEYAQWVLWRRVTFHSRQTKLPISPWNGRIASTGKPATWSSHQHAVSALKRFSCDGLGFVFTSTNPFCGVDIDSCRTVDGTIAPDALELIRRVDSYCEISPSGTGIHLVVRAKLPGRGRRAKNTELYDSGRYFTVTGNHLRDTPKAVYKRQAAITKIYSEIHSDSCLVVSPVRRVPSIGSDEELIEKGKKSPLYGTKFSGLWSGDLSLYQQDQSRADLALCCFLFGLTGRDEDRIDRLFRRSGLMRAKWDRQTGHQTYGRLTIKTATGGNIL